MMTLEEQKHPIGRFQKPGQITTKDLENLIADLRTFPERLRDELSGLSETQLNTAYRPGGWTIKQLVGHCADSHMNAVERIKLALTEEKPTIKAYSQDRWAELPDSTNIPIGSALKILEGLHERWSILLEGLTEEQLERTYIHPADGDERRIDQTVALYAWHGNHHLAHITNLKKSNAW